MIRRPDTSMNKEIYAITQKFNTILEDIISGDKRSHILKVNLDTTESNFDRFGSITPVGLYTYWKIIDNTMKDFDNGLTELEPATRAQGNSKKEIERNDSQGNYNNYHRKLNTHLDGTSFHRNHTDYNKYKWSRFTDRK